MGKRFGILVGAAALVIGGCERDARLADHDVRALPPGPITAYGRTLDQGADPRDVVFVFCRAVVDDYAAGSDRAAREEAFDIQLATAVPAAITAQWQRLVPDLDGSKADEAVYRAVRRWAPTLGFYRASLDEDYDALIKRMRTLRRPVANGQPEMADVYLNLDHPDPARPDAGALAIVRLVREDGFWRISWVGYDYTARSWQARFASR